MKRIPIAVARRVAEETGASQVVMILRTQESTIEPDVVHVVTYGKSVEDCRLAAEAGNNLKRYMGWPEEMCHDIPARMRVGKRKRKVRNEGK